MKDRLVTFALAISALAAFYALFLAEPVTTEEATTRPMTTEAGPNGYLGIWAWLQAQGIPVESLRDRYTRLESDRTQRSVQGNLLITTLPHRLPARQSEADALAAWVRRGNTLLVMAAMSDTPEWSVGSQGDQDLINAVARLSGLNFFQAVPDVPVPESEEGIAPPSNFLRLPVPLERILTPTGTHPLIEGVQVVRAVSEFPTSLWNAVPADGAALGIAATSDSRVPSLWVTQEGRGRIIVSALGSPLTNKVVGRDDNAELLANIVHWSLSGTGRVLFDDAHQGLVAFYDPEAFYGDSRLHHTLLWILLLWLVFVLGSQHLRRARSAEPPPDVVGFVKATGGFLARVLHPAEAGRWAFRHFFNVLRRRLGLAQDGEPLWEWLATQGPIAPDELKELRALYEGSLAQRRVDLVRTHNLMAHLLEKLA